MIVQVLLPTRVGGNPINGQPTIVASPSFDVWSFGVVLFELCTGAPLFMHDVNDDTLLWDAHTLATWIKPNEQQLDLILRPAYQNGSASFVMQLIARDLVLKCLQGDPRSRPSSMAEILEHQFFSRTGHIVLQRPLPHPGKSHKYHNMSL